MGIGQWRKDMQDRDGSEARTNLAQSFGQDKHGYRHGKGQFCWADGSIYDGDFVENDIDGDGHYTWSNNCEFKGQWRRNQMHGTGVFTWSDGQTYEGAYV